MQITISTEPGKDEEFLLAVQLTIKLVDYVNKQWHGFCDEHLVPKTIKAEPPYKFGSMSKESLTILHELLPDERCFQNPAVIMSTVNQIDPVQKPRQKKTIPDLEPVQVTHCVVLCEEDSDLIQNIIADVALFLKDIIGPP